MIVVDTNLMIYLHVPSQLTRHAVRTRDIDVCVENMEMISKEDPHIVPRPIDFNDEGKARIALLGRCPFGEYRLADPDGTLIDVRQDH